MITPRQWAAESRIILLFPKTCHGTTIETIRTHLPTMPIDARFTNQAPHLVEVPAKNAASTGLTDRDWQLVRRDSLAIEDGLMDERLW